MLHLIQPRPQRIFLLKEDGNEGEFDGDVHFGNTLYGQIWSKRSKLSV